jgi:hypothetical protein
MRIRGRLRMVATLGACAIGCNALAGIDAATLRDDAAVSDVQDDTPPDVLDACDTCMQVDACSAESAQCAHDATCAPRASCMRACPPGALDCIEACSSSSTPTATDVIASYEDCRTSKCFDACGVTCGDVPALVDDDHASSCATCVAASCCTEASACGAIADCWSLVECVNANTTIDRQRSCRYVQYPNGTKPFEDFETCLRSACSDACAFGSDWSCVGHVLEPATTAVSVSIISAAVDAESFAGLHAIHWRLCGAYDPDCATPYDQGTTPDGQITSSKGITLSGSFGGYLELDDPSGGYLPSITHADPGITADSTPLLSFMVSRGAAATFAGLLGVTLDTSRGIALVFAYDCAGRPATGVTFTSPTLDASARVFYFDGKLPSKTATQTDATGLAVIVNAAVGSHEITMSRSTTTLGHVSALFRAQTVSNIIVVPTKS